MLLRELSYAVLEIIREAHIVDDERIDLRLIDELVHLKRAKWLRSYLDTSKPYPETSVQSFSTAVEIYSTNNAAILRTSNTIPKPLDSRFGSMIQEIYSPVNLTSYPLSVIPFDRLRYCGNGNFNSNVIFASYREGYIYLKSKNEGFKVIDSIGIRGIFDNPTDVPGFDSNADEYPASSDLLDFIKTDILTEDIRKLLLGKADEVNDATGDITL